MADKEAVMIPQKESTTNEPSARTLTKDAESGEYLPQKSLSPNTTAQSVPLLFSPLKQNEMRKRTISPNKELTFSFQSPSGKKKSFYSPKLRRHMLLNSSASTPKKKCFCCHRKQLYISLILVGYLSTRYFGYWKTPQIPSIRRKFQFAVNKNSSPNEDIVSQKKTTEEKVELIKNDQLTYSYTDPENGQIVLATTRQSLQQHQHPRIIFYATPKMSKFEPMSKKHQITDPLLKVEPGLEAKPQDHERVPYVIGDCVPMQQWQVGSQPTCNIMHEYDLSSLGQYIGIVDEESKDDDKEEEEEAEHVYFYRMDRFSILGKGWFRHTWKGITGYPGETFVVKTLRLEREFYDEYYDLHRRDAVAMERLTHSPHILNIYGYCGQSAINEFAEFIEGYNDFEDFAKKARGKNSQKIMEVKLKIGTEIARGMQHIHEIDGPNNATMVHYDINPKNIAITKGLSAKINDFNVAEFMRWNVTTNKTCKFSGRFHEPWWRAPEEMSFSSEEDEAPLLDEKVDIYSLGNVLLDLLTGHSPRGKTSSSRVELVRQKVREGVKPKIPGIYRNSGDAIVKAMLRAIDLCFKPNPHERGSARDVVKILEDEIDHQMRKKKEK